jgi:cellulose synthase/poly-beta-1,6-N-acetylglucosamine synthase-like glycosyltransferase
MTLPAYLLFALCVAALLHTYVLYPLLVRLAAANLPGNQLQFAPSAPDLPRVTVLMSLHNEEKVIAEKMRALRDLRYPAALLRFYIGSDASSDQTNAIVADFAQKDPRIQFFPFAVRRGKPPVINELAARALTEYPAGAGHVFLLTDASAMPEPDALYRLIQHFKNPQIGVVDAHMRGAGLRREGISRSEAQYLSGEVLLKHAEGKLWGKMIGPFGGCYALRSDLFEPVPPNSLVDDFYLVFRVLERGYAAINELEAVCYEGATHRIRDEFKRKKRIAAGNFQNLARFRRWAFRPFSALGFAFISHKILRWLGGFFIAIAWLSCAWLAFQNQFFLVVFWLFSFVLVGVPLLDRLAQSLRIQIPVLKHLAYFLAMNAALIAGFIKWRRGVRDNTWERTERY